MTRCSTTQHILSDSSGAWDDLWESEKPTVTPINVSNVFAYQRVLPRAIHATRPASRMSVNLVEGEITATMIYAVIVHGAQCKHLLREDPAEMAFRSAQRSLASVRILKFRDRLGFSRNRRNVLPRGNRNSMIAPPVDYYHQSTCQLWHQCSLFVRFLLVFSWP